MKQFFARILLFILSCTPAAIGLAVAAATLLPTVEDESRAYGNGETESNLFIMRDGIDYDFAVLGISHARNLSRYGNHARVEDTLGTHFINLAQGNGFCGLNEQLFYLRYFFSRGNHARAVLIFASPPLFLSNHLNEDTRTFLFEPFDMRFFFRYLFFDAFNKRGRIVRYLKSKVSAGEWRHIEEKDTMDWVLEKVDMKRVGRKMGMAYRTDAKRALSINRRILGKIIETSRGNGARVILAVPPAVFGKWPGHDSVASICREVSRKDGIDFFDFSESILEPGFYYDHHHLNTHGVLFFADRFLRPLVSSNQSSPRRHVD